MMITHTLSHYPPTAATAACTTPPGGISVFGCVTALDEMR